MKKRWLLLILIVILLVGGAGLGIWQLMRRSTPPMLLKRAQVALQAKHYDKALNLVEAYLRKEPNGGDGYVIRGQAYLRLTEYEKARTAFEEARKNGASPKIVLRGVADSYLMPALTELAKIGSLKSENPLLQIVGNFNRANKTLAELLNVDEKSQWRLRETVALNDQRLGLAFSRLSMLAEEARDLARQTGDQDAAEKEEGKREKYKARSDQAYQDAIAKLLVVVEHDPSRDLPARTLVQLTLAQDDEAILQKVKSLFADNAKASPVAKTILLMNDLFSRKSQEGAAALREKVVQTAKELDNLLSRSDASEVRLARAEVAMMQNDPKLAISLSQEALKTATEKRWARLVLAKAYIEEDRAREAEDILLDLKTKYPHWVDAQLSFAKAAEARGDMDLAKNAMLYVINKLDPPNPEANRFMAELWLREGYYDGAYQSALAFYKAIPDAPGAVRLLVRTATLTGHDAEAQAALKQATEKHSQNPAMMLAVADGYSMLGERSKAMQMVRPLADVKPKDLEEQLLVIRAKMLTGNVAKAQAVMAELLKTHPQSAKVQFEAGWMYSRLKQTLQAIQHYREAVKLAPEIINYRQVLAQTYFDNGMLNEASEQVKKILSREQDNALAKILFEQIQIVSGDVTQKSKSMMNAEKSAPAQMALTWLRYGQPQKALDICKTTLEKTPRDVTLRLVYALSLRMVNKLPEAREQCAKAVAEDPDALAVYMQAAAILSAAQSPELVESFLRDIPGAKGYLVDTAMGIWYQRRRNWPAAGRALLRVKQNKDAPAVLRSLAQLQFARCLGLTGYYQEALRAIQSLAKEPLWSQQAAFLKAQLQAMSGHKAEAGEGLQALGRQAAESKDSMLLEAVVRICDQLNMPSQADQLCTLFEKTFPKDMRGPMLRAVLYARKNEMPKVIASYQKAISLQPGDVRIYEVLAQIQSLTGQCDAALATLKKMQEISETGNILSLYSQARLLAQWGLTPQALDRIEQLQGLGQKDNPQLQYALGQAYMALGRPEKAAKELKTIPTYSSYFVPSRRLLAAMAKTPKEALAYLDEAEALRPGQLSVWASRLNILADEKDYQAMRPLLQQAVSGSFRQKLHAGPLAQQTLNWMIQAGMEEAAAQLLDRLAAESNEAIWKLENLLILQELGRFKPSMLPSMMEASLPEASLALAGGQGDMNAWYRHWSEAVKRLPASVRKLPRWDGYRVLNALAAGNAAQARANLNQYQGEGTLLKPVAKELVDLVEKDPQTVKEVRSLIRAQLAVEMNLPSLAKRILWSLLKNRPSCQWAAAMLASLENDAEMTKQILAILKPSDCLLAQMLRADLLSREGKFAQAAAAYEKIEAVAGASSSVLLARAVALERLGRLTDALPLYEKVLTTSFDPLAANNAAYLTAQLFPKDKNRLLKAMDWIDRAMVSAPGAAAYMDTKGWLLFLRGQTQPALKLLRQAVLGLPHSIQVHYHLGRVEQAAGHSELAKWNYQAAAALAKGAGEKLTSEEKQAAERAKAELEKF